MTPRAFMEGAIHAEHLAKECAYLAETQGDRHRDYWLAEEARHLARAEQYRADAAMLSEETQEEAA